MVDAPKWRTTGDWFDVCKCTIPCPCTFAQAPSEGDCEGILAWHIREGNYGDVRLDGLNVLAVGAFDGNIWEGETKATMGIFLDERADEAQRGALQMIFGGQTGGWPGEFASMIGEVRGIEYAPIEFEIADDLAFLAGRDPGQGGSSRRGPERADFTVRRCPRPGAQRSRRRGRPWAGCDLGEGDCEPQYRRIRLQVRLGGSLEQALPLRLVRPVGNAATIRLRTYGGDQVSTWSVLRLSCRSRSPVGLVKQPGTNVSADTDLALAA